MLQRARAIFSIQHHKQKSYSKQQYLDETTASISLIYRGIAVSFQKPTRQPLIGAKSPRPLGYLPVALKSARSTLETGFDHN